MFNAAPSTLDSRFAPFLFATILEGPGDTPVTVVSLLARRDVDPWEEAARLARLPRQVAAGKLGGWIAAIPNGSAELRDTRAIAARLVALLPPWSERKSVGPQIPRQDQQFGMEPRIVTHALPYLTLLALLLASQWVVGQYQEVARTGSAAVAAARTMAPGTDRSAAAVQYVRPRSGSRPKVGD